MIENIIIALLSGLMGAYGMYLLCNEKERREYKEYDKQLKFLTDNSNTAIERADAAVSFLKMMGEQIRHNRDDLDMLLPEFTKLKQWSYHYVQYMPRKENHAVKEEAKPSAPVQE